MKEAPLQSFHNFLKRINITLIPSYKSYKLLNPLNHSFHITFILQYFQQSEKSLKQLDNHTKRKEESQIYISLLFLLSR